jgi:hypothetical protein
VRYPVSKTGGLHGLGGSTPSPSVLRWRHGRAREGSALLPPFHSGVVERKDARLLLAKRRFEPCRRSCTSEHHAPVVDEEMTPGSQPGGSGFDSRRGYRRHHLSVGEQATPPVSGTGDRWFDSSQTDLRGRGAAVLASLMSSRSWVRIPPALFLGDVAQKRRAVGCRPTGRRFEPGRPRQLVVAVM